MSFAPGEALGRYEIVRPLGRGGMAEVYVARVRGIGGFEKEVALKCVLPELAAEPRFTQMFLDEARVAAKLEHPNIVQVFDLGLEGEHLFFAMEYVAGKTARSLLRAAGRLPLPQAIAIVLGTASAAHHAHERGVVHRDISPSNVLISSSGVVKLADFGIAKAASNRHVTSIGSIKGKIGYMSPEQCRGDAIDRRSDVFSLGVLLYELTTGRLPFEENDPIALAEAIAKREPPSPSAGGYPRPLESAVMRALARDPRDRYTTADALAIDLERVARHERLDASPRALAAYVGAADGAHSAPLSPDHVTASATAEPETRREAPPTGGRSRMLIAAGGLALLAGGSAVWIGLHTDEVPSQPSPSPAAESHAAQVAPSPPPSEPQAREPEPPPPPPAPPPTPVHNVPRAPAKRAAAHPSANRPHDKPADPALSGSDDAPLPGSWRPK